MELFAIISIVSSILSIILFFKIWGMTNDVKNIKENLQSGVDATCLATGDKEEIKKALCSIFINESQTFVKLVQSGNMAENYAVSRIKALATSFNKKAEVLGVDIDFTAIAADLLPKMQALSNIL
jgi:hypothetical protein